MLPKCRQTDTTCIVCTFARWEHGFVLLLLATNATISCKTLVKIGPVVSAENILIEIALRTCSRRGSAYRVCHPISLDVLDRFSQSFHHMKVLYMPMMDLYLILQFVKGAAMATK